jgi:hypothetical protein
MNAANFEMQEKPENDLFNAKLAYTIIQSLLTSNEALNDLLAVMAHVLDEDVAKALTDTNQWQNYIDSKRELETTKLQIEKFTEELKKMENG